MAPGSIRQRMKYLEIDPVLIIAHPKRSVFVRNIKSAAGCTLLLFTTAGISRLSR